jgi:hypothetical protein
LDSYEAKKERDRLYQAQRRANQRALVAQSSDSQTTQSSYVAISEEDIEEDKEIDIDKEKRVDCQQIADLYNSICTSFPKLRSLSDSRRKAIKARLNTYSLEDFQTVFENAESSSFLKGSNDRNWTATFDWLIKDTNMVKVLEGNYADKGKTYGRKEKVPGWLNKPFEMGDAEQNAIRQLMGDDLKEAEQLRKELQESFGRK